jgi:hypothetical protein
MMLAFAAIHGGMVLVAQAPVATQASRKSAAAPSDPGWPRVHTSPTGNRVQVYQPQIASWEGQQHLVAYVAVAHLAAGATEPVLGSIKVEAQTTVALEQRLVSFASLRITETNFGIAGRARTKEIVADIETALPEFERVIALDRVLAGVAKSRILAKNVDGVKADPPAIFFSTKPALLVGFDGDPIWSPISGNDLKYAVNTNWDVFEHVPSKTFFMRNQQMWLKAAALRGPWVAAGPLPGSFGRLPADDNWKDVKASLPGRSVTAAGVPAVFVSTTPAELILLRGTPSYEVVPGSNQLLWVNNTESDVFRLGKTGPVFYLVAGRWFSAPGFDGPWTFATPSLPPDFQQIPSEHARARVLASIPGTAQASEAIVLAQIPQTAKVQEKSLAPPDVRYQGEPDFQPIEPTSLHRAVNTDKDVIKAGDLYYMCFQGVWFMSRTPRGPWQIAREIPNVIYSIPPSSPVHHVTYVTVTAVDRDWVTFSASAGYTGVTVAWGCVVWGTGWYYPPYVSYVGYYPIYYPYYPTYGYSAWYNPWTGSYQRGAVAYGPYGGVGAAARYNPSTGTYARGAMAWGPYGATGAGQAYNPRTGTYAQTRQASGVYGSWGSTYVQRGDDWAHTARVTNNVTGTTARVTRTDDGAMVSGGKPGAGGFVAAGEEGIYAGHDGSVYRRGEGGGWQKYENGTWGAVERPADNAAQGARERAGSSSAPPDRSTIGQLDHDRSARIEGGQRMRDAGSYGRGGRGTGASGRSGARGRGGRG